MASQEEPALFVRPSLFVHPQDKHVRPNMLDGFGNFLRIRHLSDQLYVRLIGNRSHDEFSHQARLIRNKDADPFHGAPKGCGYSGHNITVARSETRFNLSRIRWY